MADSVIFTLRGRTEERSHTLEVYIAIKNIYFSGNRYQGCYSTELKKCLLGKHKLNGSRNVTMAGELSQGRAI